MAGMSQPEYKKELVDMATELSVMEEKELEMAILQTSDNDLENIGSEQSPMELVKMFSKRLLAVIDRFEFSDYAKGRIFHAAGEYREAEFAYKKAFDADPKLYRDFGALYEEIGSVQSARWLYEEAVGRKVPEASYSLGCLYLSQKSYQQAYDWFAYAIKKDFDEGYLGIGKVYATLYYSKKEESYNFEDAIGNFKDAERLGVKGAEFELGKLYHSRAFDLIRSQEGTISCREILDYITLAKDYFERAIAEGFDEAYNFLGVLYAYTGNEEKAEECYDLARKAQDLGREKNQQTKAQEMRTLGEGVRIRIIMEQVQVSNLTAEEHFAVAERYETMSETGLAISHYEKAIGSEYNDEATRALIRLHRQTGDNHAERGLLTVHDGEGKTDKPN